ncbi:MAG: hypothetical protein OEY01_11190 [Desulfobulbaceae bacterium]|nr:hypothetical protein [Desulfobulbaceae bacterium]
MKQLIIFIFAWSLTSCLTVNRIQKNCDKFATVCVVPVKTVIQRKDTTIYLERKIPVPIPGDTVRIEIPVMVKGENNQPVIRPQISIKPIYRESEHIVLTAKIENNKILAEARLKEGFVIVSIEDTITIKDAIVNTTTENNIIQPPFKFIPKLYKFTFWLFWSEMLAIALLVVWKLKGGVIKKILR